MADRIVILAANPGRVRTDRGEQAAAAARLPLAAADQPGRSAARGHHAQRNAGRGGSGRPAAAAAVYEPLPAALPSEVVGLLEYLDARGGKEDIYRIGGDTNREYGQVINIVKAAEMMDLVDTPKRLVVLEPDGKAFVTASPPDRQALWRQHLLRLRLFRDVYEALKKQPRREIDDDFVRDLIALHMPQESNDRVFQTFLHWARFGDLFEYDEATEKLSLAEESPTAAA